MQKKSKEKKTRDITEFDYKEAISPEPAITIIDRAESLKS
jgi:hypothetical protein